MKWKKNFKKYIASEHIYSKNYFHSSISLVSIYFVVMIVILIIYYFVIICPKSNLDKIENAYRKKVNNFKNLTNN